MFTLVLAPAVALAQVPDSVQETLRDLRERVDELEDQQAKTAERLGSRALLQSYTARSLDSAATCRRCSRRCTAKAAARPGTWSRSSSCSCAPS